MNGEKEEKRVLLSAEILNIAENIVENMKIINIYISVIYDI